jgi:hypothetical protein
MKKLFIIFAILCLAAPAMAADWNFYGSARFATFRIDIDPDMRGVDSDEDTQWAQQGNSRIGATVKFNDQIGGGFEMSDSFGKRKLYGTYTFGNGGQLLIGQTYTPSALFYSNSVFDADGDMLGIGEFYESRLPMIQFKTGGLKVALITPDTDGVGDWNVNTDLPKIEVGYGFKSDVFFVDVFGGYQTYEVDAQTDSWDVDSYILGGGVGANFGAFFVKVGAHYGQNLGNYGAYVNDYMTDAGWDDEAASDDADADGMGYLAVVGFTASEMLTLEAGYGHEEVEIDDTDNTQEANQYYLNCTVNIAPGFFIVPEVGMMTFEEDASNAEPEVFYWGAKWQINF